MPSCAKRWRGGSATDKWNPKPSIRWRPTGASSSIGKRAGSASHREPMALWRTIWPRLAHGIPPSTSLRSATFAWLMRTAQFPRLAPSTATKASMARRWRASTWVRLAGKAIRVCAGPPHDFNGGSDGVHADVFDGPEMYLGAGWYREEGRRLLLREFLQRRPTQPDGLHRLGNLDRSHQRAGPPHRLGLLERRIRRTLHGHPAKPQSRFAGHALGETRGLAATLAFSGTMPTSPAPCSPQRPSSTNGS
jgi:hypothetical protein